VPLLKRASPLTLALTPQVNTPQKIRANNIVHEGIRLEAQLDKMQTEYLVPDAHSPVMLVTDGERKAPSFSLLLQRSSPGRFENVLIAMKPINLSLDSGSFVR